MARDRFQEVKTKRGGGKWGGEVVQWFCRGPRLGPQCPRDSSQLEFITLVPRDLVTSSGSVSTRHAHGAHTHMQANTHIYKINRNKSLNPKLTPEAGKENQSQYQAGT